MHGDHPRLGERQHARRARRDELADRGQRRLGRVQHHVAVAARLDDRAQHRGERRCHFLVARDEHGFRLEQHAERAQAVRAQRVPRRDEVDDRVGQAEPRRDLDRAGHVDQRHVDRQQLARQVRIDGRDGQRPRARRATVAGDSSGTAASSRHEPKPSGSSSLHLGAALAHEVDAGDAAVDDAVLHVLRARPPRARAAPRPARCGTERRARGRRAARGRDRRPRAGGTTARAAGP